MIENSEFSIICDILSFNIIYNPDGLNNFKTMFIWDFLIDIFQNATYLNKNKIIQVYYRSYQKKNITLTSNILYLI